MRLEIAERLRCPRAHAATPLVVVAHRTVERELVAGVAGCPSCHLEAELRQGDVFFPGAQDAPLSGSVDAAALERVLALLGLAEPGGSVLLTGRYVALAAALTEHADVAVVTLNARGPAGEGVSAVFLTEPALPFSDHTFRAAALDALTPLPVLLDALRTVQPGGRVLGALPLERPLGVRELARDATEWVGEREAGPGGIVTIRRA